jgi:competence protein ComEC
MFIFDVGFQLSYLAVFGIVWLQPKLYAVWKPKLKWVRFFWQLCTVSIAAQVVIFPISIYYFHQFPGLFLASNLVIIPCLMYILIGGVVLIFLALFQLLPQFFAEGYGFVISLMNHFVSFISKQEQFLFKEISLSIGMMLAWYVVIIFTTQFLIHKKANNALFFLSSIVLFQCVFLYEFTENNSQKEWIVFHKSRKSVIGKRIGKTLFLQHNIDTLQLKDEYSLQSYRISENIKIIHQTRFNNFMNFQDTKILLVDRLGVYKIKGFVKPIVVLQNSPKINLRRLIQYLDPIQIVADGSNYTSDIKRWKFISAKQQVPFHYTGEKGAFIVKY